MRSLSSSFGSLRRSGLLAPALSRGNLLQARRPFRVSAAAPVARAATMTAGSQSVAKARPAIKQDRPSFHIAPPKGWLNDPNGPLFYAGYYHMFYQHIPESCIWSFGLVWGHAVSRDLVTWEHLPPAIVPTPGGLDADGCFSGCATLDEHGVPTILYTGVRLRSNGAAGPLPPVETDLQLPFIESQCAARPVDPSDPKLTHWTKIEYPWMALPPANWGLGGWRDPYIISRPGADGSGCWSLIIGSGVKDNGGTVLVYKSKELLDGWQLHGELCHGRGEGSTTGFIWECPLLTKLPVLPAHIARGGVVSHGNASRASTSESGDLEDTPHFFCISPDACTNPSYYWLGRYDTESMTFNLKGADGPFRLDLGDILYAPNTLEDTANGRTLLWGWNQEKRTKVGAYDYAGCLSVPRILWAEPSTVAAEPSSSSSNQSSAEPSRWALHQQPVPELSRLRKTDAASCWRLSDDLPGESAELIILGSARLPLPVVSGPFLDIELVLERADSGCTASGLLLTSTTAEGGAALLYHWDSGVLEVVFEALDPHTLTFSLAAPGARRVGGPLLRPPAPGQPLSLRVFLDYSCLEVFTGDGEVLTARVYRGVPPAPPPAPRGTSGRGSSSGGGSAATTRRVSPLGTPRRQQQQAAALQALQLKGLALPASPSAAAGMLPDPFNHEQGHHGPHHHLLAHDAYASGGAAAAGVELVSFGCATEFESVAAYEVGEIWVDCA